MCLSMLPYNFYYIHVLHIMNNYILTYTFLTISIHVLILLSVKITSPCGLTLLSVQMTTYCT